MRKYRWLCIVLAALLFLTACGEGAATPVSTSRMAGSESSVLDTAAGVFENSFENLDVADTTLSATDMVPMAAYSTTSEGYMAPAFAMAEYHASLAQGTDRVRLDLSGVNEGYVAVSATSDKRLKFQVVCGETTYNYDLDSDGTPWVYPLQCGSGKYRFRVMENVSESRYAELYSKECQVELSDEFAPFLRPSAYVSYDRDSDCVDKAKELAAQATDAVGVVSNVYSFICKSVVYDRRKAATVQSGYLPNPDETLQTGKGICFDYAALAAAMLRSQGIPTKMVFGYVSPNDLYHAWNMFYTSQTGWVTVKFEVTKDSWNRLDLTFSASGADSRFIGDGSNYTDLYYY